MDDKTDFGGRAVFRRDFLGTGAKVGAGLAIAGAGLDLKQRHDETRRRRPTLNRPRSARGACHPTAVGGPDSTLA
jgi:hypothetical protein